MVISKIEVVRGRAAARFCAAIRYPQRRTPVHVDCGLALGIWALHGRPLRKVVEIWWADDDGGT